MKLIGLMPVRNEAWVLGLSARVALKWCDELVILLHACTDTSHEIAWEIYGRHEGRVHICDWNTPPWDEMLHRQFLLEQARMNRATHIAIIDADEILTGNLWHSGSEDVNNPACCIRSAIATMPPGNVLQLPGYNLRGGTNRYHANGVWGNRWFSTAFADDPRFGWSGDRFHQREPMGPGPASQLKPWRPIGQKDGGVMHLWGASERRLLAKHALYKLTERLRWPDKPVSLIERLYNLAIYGHRGVPGHEVKDWTYADTPACWWAPYRDLMQYLDVDAVPWQEAEVQRLVAEHGAARFTGLDLFGVA